MTHRPTVPLLMAALFAGRLIGCISGVAEGESAAADGPRAVRGDEAIPAGGTVEAGSAEPGTVEAMLAVGEFEAAADVLLGLPSRSVTDKVLEQLEASAAGLSRQHLTTLAGLPGDWTDDPRVGPVFAELALRHASFGDTGRANAGARRVVEAGARGKPLQVAEAVLRGDLSGLVPRAPVIGAILPESGSPSNREYARLFAEGMEVAAAMARRAGLRAELMVEDNQGTRSGSVGGASELVSRGAVAILGPLSDENLEAAVRAAPNDVVFLSPTARRLPAGRRGVYTMGAGDPEAGSALAEAVAGLGYADAIVVHPNSHEETLEARAFEEAFRARGGIVTRRLPYAPGTTTYGLELQQVGVLAPRLLVLAAPPGDVVLLAPQIAFFGLDTLDIQVAGTGGWTTSSVLESVDPRHTNRVIAVSTALPGTADNPAVEFREAYEGHFRRTLRSPVPAAGFDLFRMVLAAYGEGYRTSRDLADVMGRLRGFEGATGIYSFVDGRLVREHFPVRIYNRDLHPVSADAALPSERP